MIVIRNITFQIFQSQVRIKLPHADMVIDPRPGYLYYPRMDERRYKFNCVYGPVNDPDGSITVTLTRGHDKAHTVEGPFHFRAYDTNIEEVPDFDSNIYIYQGVDLERPPISTTQLIIPPSVKVIKKDAFADCDCIEKCIMHDGVHTIESGAFYRCSDMKVIKLSRGLKVIGFAAFYGCRSLEALFIPPSVERIHEYGVKFCDKMRVLSLPPTITYPIFLNVFPDCRALEKQYQYHVILGEIMQNVFRNRFQVIAKTLLWLGECVVTDKIQKQHKELWWSMIHRNDDRLPLHKLCLDPHVSAQKIEDFFQATSGGDNTASTAYAYASQVNHMRMTPLHILVMNPHAGIGAIEACYHANPLALHAQDDEGTTPLDYLWKISNTEAILSLMRILSLHRDGLLLKRKSRSCGLCRFLFLYLRGALGDLRDIFMIFATHLLSVWAPFVAIFFFLKRFWSGTGEKEL